MRVEVLAVLIALLSLTAVPAQARGKILVYNPLEGAEGDPIRHSLLSQFRDQNPDLQVEEREAPSAYLQEAQSLAQQPGQAVFTIIYAIKFPRLADQGVLAPIDRLAPAELWQDHYPKVLQTVTYKDRIWALPLEANPYGLFCNLEHFREAGVGLPTTWEETLAAARALTRDTDGDGKIDRWGYTQCTFQFPLELWSYGIDVIRPDGAVGFADPPAAEILHWYWELRHYSPPHVDFERGDVAMKVSVTDNLSRYRHMDYKVIPLPRGTRRVNSLGGSNSTLGLVLINGSDPEVAKRFLAFWAWPPAYLRWCTWTHNLPLRKSIRQGAAYQRYLLRNPAMQVFNDDFDYALPRPVRPEYDPIHDIVARLTNWAAGQPTQPSVQQCQARLDQAKIEAEALLPK